MNVLTYLFPILTVLLLLVLFLTLPDLRSCLRPMDMPPLPRGKKKPRLLGEDRSRSLSRADALPILLITLIYAATAFFRLGSTTDPQTFAAMEKQDVILSLPEGELPSQLVLYPGVGMGGYYVFYSEDGEKYEHVASFTQDHIAVLKWTRLTPETTLRPRYIRIICNYGDPWLGEVLVLNGDGQPIAYSCSVSELCDEQDTMPQSFGFQNSSYFDEIYHARTAWEHLNGVSPYETTHPPLGKEIIGVGILLFGMTPFGWRFSGTFFGVLMLPLLYILLKKLFGGRLIPSLGTLIFATDFMHYVQTRISTIDTYSVFFILLMYLFMYLWLTEERPCALALCGVSFGLGAASKWTSIYAGAGLALLWLVHWIGRFRAERRERTERESDEEPVLPAFWKNVLFCLVFFIAIPGLIYLLSYIPYARANGTKVFSGAYLHLVVGNQVNMFVYHSKSVLGSTHPYSSTWYQWLIDYRPILYVLEYPTADTRISIAAWLNPVLCWGGLMSLPVLGWMAIARKDRRAAFILVGYLSQLLPWIPVPRLTFAYHYFPSALFLVLSLGYVMALLRENRPDWRVPAVSLTAGCAAVFLLFFPVLNGLPIKPELAGVLYRWLSSWPM